MNGLTYEPSPLALSAQVIVNCGAGGSCFGGDPHAVYRFAYKEGIPHASCEQYVAHNPLNGEFDCQAIDKCKDCTGPPPPMGETMQENCWATDYHHYYVSNYYALSTAERMKAEIYKYGPIECGIESTEKFDTTYTGGIYEELIENPEINHSISVIGWGVEESTGIEYWIGRNSWGTYWGEFGFFKMRAGEYGLGIENDCSAGVPTNMPPQHEEQVTIIQ